MSAFTSAINLQNNFNDKPIYINNSCKYYLHLQLYSEYNDYLTELRLYGKKKFIEKNPLDTSTITTNIKIQKIFKTRVKEAMAKKLIWDEIKNLRSLSDLLLVYLKRLI